MTDEPKPDLDDGIISVSQSFAILRSSPFFWIASGAVLLLAGSMVVMIYLIAMVAFGDRSDRAQNIKRYHELRAILEDVRAVRNSPSPDFSAVHKRAAAAKRTMVPELKRSVTIKTPVKQVLLFAVRDELPSMMQGDLQKTSSAEQQFEASLDRAAQGLGLK